MAHYVNFALFFWFGLRCTLANQRNPFDMFYQSGDPVEAGTYPENSAGVPQITSVDHFRELHRMLTRIIWENLRSAENLLKKPQEVIRLNLLIELTDNDVRILSHYCSSNDSLNKISPDIVNSIFSRIFQSASVPTESTFGFSLSDPVVVYAIGLGVGLLFIMSLFCFIRFTLLRLAFFVLMVTFAQCLLSKYNERVAEKMSFYSRYTEPPDECKPRAQQSWLVWFRHLVFHQGASDECARYHFNAIANPLLSTSLLEAFVELLCQPLISTVKAMAKCIGQFYHQLSEYLPIYILVPVMICCFFIVLCVINLSFQSFLIRPVRTTDSKRRCKIKCSSVPSIKAH